MGITLNFRVMPIVMLSGVINGVILIFFPRAELILSVKMIVFGKKGYETGNLSDGILCILADFLTL